MRFVLQNDKLAFSDYTPSLKALESSFRKAGLNISFWADCSLIRGRRIHVRNNGMIMNTVYIEADSPAQAIKSVTFAVRL
jgi:hypothetical protein